MGMIRTIADLEAALQNAGNPDLRQHALSEGTPPAALTVPAAVPVERKAGGKRRPGRKIAAAKRRQAAALTGTPVWQVAFDTMLAELAPALDMTFRQLKRQVRDMRRAGILPPSRGRGRAAYPSGYVPSDHMALILAAWLAQVLVRPRAPSAARLVAMRDRGLTLVAVERREDDGAWSPIPLDLYFAAPGAIEAQRMGLAVTYELILAVVRARAGLDPAVREVAMSYAAGVAAISMTIAAPDGLGGYPVYRLTYGEPGAWSAVTAAMPAQDGSGGDFERLAERLAHEPAYRRAISGYVIERAARLLGPLSPAEAAAYDIRSADAEAAA